MNKSYRGTITYTIPYQVDAIDFDGFRQALKYLQHSWADPKTQAKWSIWLEEDAEPTYDFEPAPEPEYYIDE